MFELKSVYAVFLSLPFLFRSLAEEMAKQWWKNAIKQHVLCPMSHCEISTSPTAVYLWAPCFWFHFQPSGKLPFQNLPDTCSLHTHLICINQVSASLYLCIRDWHLSTDDFKTREPGTQLVLFLEINWTPSTEVWEWIPQRLNSKESHNLPFSSSSSLAYCSQTHKQENRDSGTVHPQYFPQGAAEVSMGCGYFYPFCSW